MLDLLRFLRRVFFPRPREVIARAFSIEEREADAIASGSSDLGTFFYDKLGFSEDTWPIVLVGQFVPQFAHGDTPYYYDFRCFRRRLILDLERKWGRVEVCWRKKHLKDPGIAHARHGFEGIDALACHDETNVLRVATLPDAGRCPLTVSIDTSHTMLGVIASRLNYIQKHGRAVASRTLGEWGERKWGDIGLCRWRNPDASLVELLRQPPVTEAPPDRR